MRRADRVANFEVSAITRAMTISPGLKIESGIVALSGKNVGGACSNQQVATSNRLADEAWIKAGQQSAFPSFQGAENKTGHDLCNAGRRFDLLRFEAPPTAAI